MEPIVLVAVLAVVIAGLLWWRSRQRNVDAPSTRPLEALDTLSAWEPTPTRILTAQERLAYNVLVRALPEHLILAQVPLSRFLKVPTRNSYSEWLSRVGQLCADLVVCDPSTAVVAVIDVRVPPHQASDRNRKRHERMKRVLKAAGIPLHVWIENALPTPEVARDAILPKRDPDAPAPARPAPAPAARAQPQPDFGDELADMEPDEVIEMSEPPPSTWFDSIESQPSAPRPSSPAGDSAPRSDAGRPPGAPRR